MAVEFTMIMRWANLVLPKDHMTGRTGSPKWSGSPSTRLAESIGNIKQWFLYEFTRHELKLII